MGSRPKKNNEVVDGAVDLVARTDVDGVTWKAFADPTKRTAMIATNVVTQFMVGVFFSVIVCVL